MPVARISKADARRADEIDATPYATAWATRRTREYRVATSI